VQLGRTVGTVVATVKHASLAAAKLLLVQPLTPAGEARGTPVIAVDAVGAGAGERVLLVLEGRAAGEATDRRLAPVDAAIVGIVDAVAPGEDAS
jgi:ethanolamine utilization protein EutN